MAESFGLELDKNNRIFGLDRSFMTVKKAKVIITMGNDQENYSFPILVHVPLNDVPINTIIGRQGIFDAFEITFNQAQKKIRFKRINK